MHPAPALNLPSLWHPFHQPLNQPESSRAVFNILLKHVHIIHHPPLGMMRKPGAISRPDRVNAALIVFQVEKLARLLPVHPIACAVFIQPFLAECFFRHTKMCCNPLYVFPRIGWRHRLAAIGAGQAICFLPYMHIFLHNQCIQSPRRFLFKPGKKSFKGGPVGGHSPFIRAKRSKH